MCILPVFSWTGVICFFKFFVDLPTSPWGLNQFWWIYENQSCFLKETTGKKKPQTTDEVVEDKERDELEALAKKFEAKYVSMNSAKIIFLALSC